MFGYATLAQSPFAALGSGGNSIDVDFSSSASAGSDTVTAQGNVFVATLNTSGSTQDTANTINNIFNNVLASTASASNTQDRQFVGGAVIDESVDGLDTYTNVATLLGAVAENISSAFGFATAASVLYSAISAAASGLASVSTNTSLAVAISEGASAASTQTVQVVFVGTLAGAANAASTLGVLRAANVYPDGTQLYVRVGGALVWGMIDDTQTPNWQNITNTQTPSWADVDDTQAPDWNQLPS